MAKRYLKKISSKKYLEKISDKINGRIERHFTSSIKGSNYTSKTNDWTTETRNRNSEKQKYYLQNHYIRIVKK